MYLTLSLIYLLMNQIFPMQISLEENETTSSCIENLIDKLFDQKSPIFYIRGEKNLKFIFPSRETFVYHYKSVRTHANKNYIIQTKNYNETSEIMNFLSTREKLWNARANFIIYLTDEEDIVKILEEILKADLRKFILVTKQNKIRSLDPYDEENVCGMYAKKISTTTCEDLQQVKFFEKIKNLHNCNFTFLIHDKKWSYPLANYKNLSDLYVYNFPLELMRAKFGLKISYKVVDGIIDSLNDDDSPSLEKILDKTIDTRAGELHYGYGTIGENRVEITDIFFFSPSYWVVVKPNLMSNVQILGYIFNEVIWVSILSIFVFVVSFCYFLMRKTEERKEMTNLVTKIFSVNLGMGIGKMPKSKSLKILLLFFMLYSFHLVCFYQGTLSSFLTTPVYEKGINNMEELAESDEVVIYDHAIYVILLSYSDLPFVKKLQKKAIIHSQSDIDYLDLLMEWKNFSREVSRLVLSIKPYSHKLRTIGDLCLPQMTLFYALRRGHPLFEFLNGVVKSIREHGLYQPLLNYITRKKFVESEERNEIVLTTDHILGAIFILFGGYVFGLFVFFLELLSFKMKECHFF